MSYIIGIVGAGQLARMMYEPSIGLGLEIKLLAENENDCAAQIIPKVTVGDYRDYETLANFAEGCDVITFDHEHVPTKHLLALERLGVKVHPNPRALVYAQDKVLMRERMTELGMPCPKYKICENPQQLINFGDQLGWPVIAKTSRGGYDGKGVWKLTSPNQAADPFKHLVAQSAGEKVQIIAEEYINFSRELSALVVRSVTGQLVSYPISQTKQHNGICVETLTPAPNMSDLESGELQSMALRIATELDVVGVLAVELMEAPDGRIVINELAMRPHNTGHWSIDGALTSQFENHLRAVIGLGLGSSELLANQVAMVNILGGKRQDLVAELPHCFAHDNKLRLQLYGKQVRPGRKIGHVTTLGKDAMQRALHAANYLMGKDNE